MDMGKTVRGLVAGMLVAGALVVPTTALATTIDQSVVHGLDTYTVMGATYELYKGDRTTKVTKDADGNPISLVIDKVVDGKRGETQPVKVPQGTYSIKETVASEYGTVVSTKWIDVVVGSGNTTSANAAVARSSEPLVTVDGDLGIRKEDENVKDPVRAPETMITDPTQGSVSLAGGVFRIDYYDRHYGDTGTVQASHRKKTWFFSTDANGAINMRTAPSVTWVDGNGTSHASDSFYAIDGRRVYLLGTYVVTEVEAPAGFALDNRNHKLSYQFDAAQTSRGSRDLTHNGIALIHENAEIRFRLVLDKVDFDTFFEETEPEFIVEGQGDARLAGARFRLVNKNAHQVSLDNGLTTLIEANSEFPEQFDLVVEPVDDDGDGKVDGVRAETPYDLPWGVYGIYEVEPGDGYRRLIKTALPDIDARVLNPKVPGKEQRRDDVYRIGRTRDEWLAVGPMSD